MVNKGRIVRNYGTMVAAEAKSLAMKQTKKIGLYFKRGGSHRCVLNLGMIRSDLGFLNLILAAVRRIDVRVTRVEVERE